MSEVKTFKVEGEIHKPNYKMKFSKDIRALKPEEALEKMYAELGGQHRVKRFQMKVASIEEVKQDSNK